MTVKTQNAESQASISPDQGLRLLEEGNRRFREGRRTERDLMEQVAATSGGQWPFAVVLGCIDSRASAELVFDTGIGDIFCARVAGNFVNDDILGSMEFACKVANAKVIVVLGHTHCGAVKGACDKVELGLLTGMLGKLEGAVDAVAEPSDAAQRTSANADFVQAVARKNVDLTVQAIRDRSAVLNEMEQSGTIRIVGAMYDVETGHVHFAQA